MTDLGDSGLRRNDGSARSGVVLKDELDTGILARRIFELNIFSPAGHLHAAASNGSADASRPMAILISSHGSALSAQPRIE